MGADPLYWLNGAFVGSTDATARWLDGKLSPEYAAYLKVMAHREYRNVRAAYGLRNTSNCVNAQGAELQKGRAD